MKCLGDHRACEENKSASAVISLKKGMPWARNEEIGLNETRAWYPFREMHYRNAQFPNSRQDTER